MAQLQSTSVTGSIIVSGSSTTLLSSGSTVLDIQGSQGQLFSVTDSLTGVLMSVNDISGLPILEVSSDDKVVMGTFGANTLVVTGSRVGIGTTTPGVTLDVNGSARTAQSVTIGNDGNYEAGSIYSDSNWGMIFRARRANPSLADFRWANSADVERMRIDACGNVGIGTCIPGTKLEVNGAIRGGCFSAGATNTGEAWFGRASDRTLGTYTLQLGGASASNTHFEIVDRAWTKVIALISGEAPGSSFIVNSGGNVGIGTTTPGSYKLYVNGGQFGTLLRGGDLGAGSDIVRMNKSDDSTAMLVRGDGAVGIGTTSPASNLHVVGSARVVVNSGAGGDTLLGAINGVSNGYRIQADSSNNITYSWNTGTNATAMFITCNGNVGIGTASPGSTLSVVGDACASGQVRAGSIVTTGGGTSQCMYIFYSNLAGCNDWRNSPISIIERGASGAGDGADCFSPNLNFHWGGRASNSAWMGANGHLNWGSYSSAGIPAVDGVFKTGTICATSCFVGNFCGNATTATSVAWANISGQRTLTRDNAGLQGNAGARSGFFETSSPTNYYSGATSWQHLIEARHSNDDNNYAMQLAGSFFDQALWFRKTNDSATTAWRRIVTNDTENTWGINTTGNAGTATTAGNSNCLGGTPAACFVTTSGDQTVAGFKTFSSCRTVFGLGTVGVPTTCLVLKGYATGPATTVDYVIQTGTGTGGTFNLPEGTGTLALTSGTVSNADCLGSAPQSCYVMTCGAQTITGLKTFNNVADGNNYISLTTGGNSRLTIGTAGSGAHVLMRTGNSVDLRMGVDANDHLVIKSTGNVGIGTTSPSSKVHISATGTPPSSVGTLPTNTLLTLDNGDNNNFITIRNRADTGLYGGILFQDNNVGGYIAFKTYVGSGANDGTNGDYMVYGTYTDHIFQAGSSETVDGKTEIMRIKGTGNVGIGTCNPIFPLSVNGGIQALGAGNDSPATGNIIYIGDGSAGSALRHTATGRAFAIDTYSSSNVWTERLRILRDGNVGIGTTNPGCTLSVVGSICSSGQLRAGTIASVGNIDIGGEISPTNSCLIVRTAGTIRACIDSVGICTPGTLRAANVCALTSICGPMVCVSGEVSGLTVRGAHKAADGTSGINQNVSFVDASAYTHTFEFKNGLLVSYSVT